MNDSAAVLLIDDDPGFTYLFQRYVHASGRRFLSTSDSDVALAMAQHERPALIVIHQLLPLTDGQRVLRALKHDRTTQTIPVLVCSALRDEERIWEEGADFCLAKPVMYADFLAILASVGLPT